MRFAQLQPDLGVTMPEGILAWRDTDRLTCVLSALHSSLLSYAALSLRTMAEALTDRELIYVPWGAAALGRQGEAVWQEIQDFYEDEPSALANGSLRTRHS